MEQQKVSKDTLWITNKEMYFFVVLSENSLYVCFWVHLFIRWRTITCFLLSFNCFKSSSQHFIPSYYIMGKTNRARKQQCDTYSLKLVRKHKLWARLHFQSNYKTHTASLHRRLVPPAPHHAVQLLWLFWWRSNCKMPLQRLQIENTYSRDISNAFQSAQM